MSTKPEQDDSSVLSDSLAALGERYEGMAAILFDRFMSLHPEHKPAFLNPEAARERMTNETIEAMFGFATNEPWVETTVINFVDLHKDYGNFSIQDYSDWFEIVIATMAERGGTDWPKGATAAWQRQAKGLIEQIASMEANC